MGKRYAAPQSLVQRTVRERVVDEGRYVEIGGWPRQRQVPAAASTSTTLPSKKHRPFDLSTVNRHLMYKVGGNVSCPGQVGQARTSSLHIVRTGPRVL